MLRTTDFQFCTNKADPDLPLAIVRYTAHDEDDKIVAVEQITYEENSEYFQTEVLSALECGVDVSVLSFFELKDFKRLNKLANAYHKCLNREPDDS